MLSYAVFLTYASGLYLVLNINTMDNNFKVKKRMEGEGKEGQRNRKKIVLVCVGENGREREGDQSYPFKYFQLQRDWNLNKKYPSNPSNSLPSKFLPSHFFYLNKGFFLPPNPSLSFPSISFHPNTPYVCNLFRIIFSSVSRKCLSNEPKKVIEDEGNIKM